MFLEYKYGTFQTLSDDEKRVRSLKIKKKILDLYVVVVHQLKFSELDNKFEKYEKIKKERNKVKSNSDSNSKWFKNCLKNNPGLSKDDFPIVEKLMEMNNYYDLKGYNINRSAEITYKKELSDSDKDFEEIKKGLILI
ncbi:hypothetical protein HERIO_1066 [Hepatospora eriocheir]|uniref:Uncharacterized protein n=1 Tax=Hepatospora eriocheir TaxID=1081669 RepID=A0A1X0QBC2_9MICR|nr:hypothetical protein HERIO_1066 [Hepatospora eriocheir]